MGKTNLLESIYYMCMTKSVFGTNDRQVVRQGSDFFRIEGKLSNGDQVVAKVIPGKQKVFEKNGVPRSRLSEHIGTLPVVMIVPDDTRLVSDGSEERRKLADNTLSQLDAQYLRHLMAYHKILRQRNAALKEMGKNRFYDPALIQAYNNQMLAPAAYIHDARQRFVASFQPVFQQYYRIISNDAETVEVEYVSKLSAAGLDDLLLENAEKDRLLQRTTVGIHKDDFKFLINGHPLRRFGSQGQLKSFVLALKLAQFEYLKKEKQHPPFLLLDDIFDKLDRHRVAQLIGLLLNEHFGQLFISDTHENRLDEIVKPYGVTYRKFLME